MGLCLRSYRQWLIALCALTALVPAFHAAAAGCFSAPAGLVGWWPGDGNANDIAGTNNGALHAGASYAGTGMAESAFTLDGTNGYVQIPDSPVLRPTNLTIEAWVNFSGLDSARSGTAPAGEQYIVFKQNSLAYSFEGYSLEKYRVGNGDAFMFTVGSASGQEVVLLSKTLISTSLWYHVAAVRGSNFMQLYVNGQLENQTNLSFAQDYGTLPLYFGTSGESYWDGKLRGMLDEVSLYNRALTSNEVAAVYAAGAAGKCKGASLVTQPQSQTVVASSNALFTVTAAGVGLLSYQWQFNGASIAAASNASLLLTNVQTTNAGSYTVVVTNSLGSVTSTVATLTVWVPPGIAAQPQNRTNVLGTDASFSVTASGTPPPAYQWQFNGAAIPGATNATLLRSAVSFADAGGYRVVLANVAGAVTSAVATLTVVCPPVALSPASLPTGTAGVAYSQSLEASGGAAPYSYSVMSGSLPSGLALSDGGVLTGTPAAIGSFSFTVRAADTNGCWGTKGYTLAIGCPAITTGPAALTSGLVGNAYNQILTASGGLGPYTFAVTAGSLPAGVGLSGAGGLNGIPVAIGTSSFTVTATDTNGCSGNQTYTLAVTGAPPVITLQPQSRTNIIGTDATFNVTASGAPLPTCQWQFNGAAIPGATDTTLLRSAVSFADAGGYRLVLTNVVGVITSGVAVLTVVCPSVTVGPAVLPIGLVGSAYSQGMTASGGQGPYTFAVTMGTLPAGLSLSSAGVLSGTPSAIGTNNFTVTGTDTNGCSGSQICSLTVTGTPPVITLQPQSRTNAAGTVATFSVTANGTQPLSYQWQLGGVSLVNDGRISGATSDILQVASVQPGDAGNYTVVVSNVAGVVTSTVGSLTVPGPPTITGQPASVSAVTGTNVSFSVSASGTPPLSYQWQFNGANIGGASDASLLLTNVQPTNAGNYRVVVTNIAGSATSAVASLIVSLPAQAGAQTAGAVVLVNSQSARYLDFQHFIQPYLDNFGFPYRVQDIAASAPGPGISNCAVIIIGHRQLDTNHTYLNTTVQANLSLAVSNGTGLVSFDSDLSSGSGPYYQFVQDIFGFNYSSGGSGSSASLPPTEPLSQMHYITARHATNDLIAFRSGISLPGVTIPSGAKALVSVGDQPLVTVVKYGQGRAVQWGSYDWMVSTVLGPVDGLDDVVWRGVVWAARKPLVMRGLPNFVTMRVDDVNGPFGWLHAVIDVGFKPFVALFYQNVSEASAADLQALTTSGNATASIHSGVDGNAFFYFNHGAEQPWPDDVQSNNFYLGTLWHTNHGIPISKICATHYSEIGLNCFSGLKAWGMEFVPIEVVPGTVEYATPGAPWLVGGPYRLYEPPQPGQVSWPTYYADWLTVPGHPEFDGQFFNIYSEVRDVASCGQWCPNNSDLAGSIDQAAQMAKRALDSMVMATIFTHEWDITPVSPANLQTMLQGITNSLSPYNPRYVTLDYASQYVRATRTSRLLSGTFDPGSGQVTATFSGKTDLDTQVYVFVGADGAITNLVGLVPVFSGLVTNTVATMPAGPMPPNIVSAPASLTTNAGATVALTVAALGTAPLTYQWLKDLALLADDGNVSGASSPTLILTGVTGTNAGNYGVVITNPVGSVTSSVATLTVAVAPVITAQPQSLTNVAGTAVTFNVTATGTTPLAYQWQFNGGSISGATAASLALNNIQASHAGNYSVVVTNVVGSATSAVAGLTVIVPPGIVAQPASLTNVAGTAVTFNVTADGTAPLVYQWQFNGGSIVGATDTSLALDNIQATNAGNYSVVVTNVAGVVTSTVASLTLIVPPAIMAQPASLTNVAGAAVTFTVFAAGTTPLAYQWQFNGGSISGAINTSFTLNKIQAANTGNYTVVVTNAAGSATSAVATLTVIVPPAIVAQPASLSVVAGSNTSLSVTASGTPPLSYQWRFNGTNIGGASDTSLALSNMQPANAGSYTVVVTNAVGAVTSAVAGLIVLVPPAISAQPVSLSVPAGTNISFSVAASGTQPLSYRWQCGGTNLSDGGQLSGVTARTLYISNVQGTNAGAYTVTITNVAGAAVSAAAALTVNVPVVCLASATGLVGWWPGDGSANDIAGTNNGSLHAGAAYTGTGMVGSAFTFDGTNGYVQIPDSPVLRPTNLTVEAWVKFSGLNSGPSATAPAGDQFIVFKQNSLSYNFEGYSLEKYRAGNGDVFMFTVSAADGSGVYLFSKTLVSTAVWYHVAVVRGSNFMQLYVNGQLENQTNVSLAQDYGTLPLYFGTSGESYWDGKLRGMLDEVSLYNRALLSNEVAAVYAAGSAGKCKAPGIATQPQSQEVMADTSALFTVAAMGIRPLSYQWQFNGANIAGATNTSLLLNNVQPTDTGSYTVVVTNAMGSVNSAAAVLTVTARPLLRNAHTSPGGTFGFTISGVDGLTYQIEVSTNLQDWMPLTSVTTTAGQANFTDTTFSISVSRFYRVVLTY